MAVLKLQNVSKSRGDSWALWDVCLDIGAGEIIGILGRSGSGKTTLARILAGLEKPTSGSVEADRPAGQKSVGVAFSNPTYAPELTVYENLDMFAVSRGIGARRRTKEIPAMLQRLNLSEYRSTPAASLPSGALAKLEIARGLMIDSSVLVIDSLMDGLDLATFESVWDYILDLKRVMGRSFVVLTRSGKVAEICGRMAVLSSGRIAFLGRPDDFRRLAGEDMIVLGDIENPVTMNRIQEHLSVVIREEDGFLSFRVTNGERVIGELLTEFGNEMSCVYLKRPTIEDALDTLAQGGGHITVNTSEKRVS